MESDCDWVNLGELSKEEKVKEETNTRLSEVEPTIKDNEIVGEESVLSDPNMEEFEIVEWDEFVAGEIPDEDK